MYFNQSCWINLFPFKICFEKALFLTLVKAKNQQHFKKKTAGNKNDAL